MKITKRSIWLILVGLLAVAGWATFNMGWKKDKAIDRIILITIDTLRADHVSCYGYPRPTTPFIDKLAGEGIRFKYAFSQIATTVPSHASIFTSQYPLQHHVQKNQHKLDASFETMAERMSAKGYKTAGFVSAWFFGESSSNLSQGFAVFDDDENSRFIKKGYKYRPADKTIDAAIAWLDQIEPNEPFLLWIHLFDPHGPYISRDAHLSQFKSQDEHERDSLVDFLIEDHKIDFDFYGGNGKRMLRTIDLYDSEIHFADSQIQRIYQHVEEKWVEPNALWILTADHGEGLGNHGWRGHGKHIYNQQIHIPLIFNFSSGLYRGMTVDQIVQHVDILPTVLELSGDEGFGWLPEDQGTSLVPFFSTDATQGLHGEYAFAQRRKFRNSPPDKEKPLEKVNYESGEKYALQNRAFKYIYRTEGESEFFDLTKDPKEIKNLAGQGHPKEKYMKNELMEFVTRFKQNGKAPSEYLDEDALENLKSLGYIQ